MSYRVHYSNEGKRESTPAWQTRTGAEECAEFLKFQGAARISIRESSEPGRPYGTEHDKEATE